MKRRLIAISALLLLTACSDAIYAKGESYGEPHVIQLWSGGQKVAEWTSTGKVENEPKSDGFFFKDAATGKLVRVSGEVVIFRK